MPNLLHSQKTADGMIKRWGGPGFLIRGAARRPCFAARSEYKPTERGLYLDGSERFFISALNLALPPDFEQDILEFKGKALKAKRYRILTPPSGPRPNGLVMYYDCNCMFVEDV